ncbi:MAG: beta-propeller domain-containing protein [Bacillota bacterium]
MQRRVFFALILLAALTFSGCTLPWKKKAQEPVDSASATEQPVDDKFSGQLKKFKDLQSLDSFLRSNGGSLTDEVVIRDYRGETVAASGDYVYAAVYNDLYIVKTAAGEQGRAVAKITFNSRPLAVFVSKGKLVVIGNDEQLLQSQAYKSFRRKSPFVFIKVFDLADPASPKQVRDLSVEGRLKDTSNAGGFLRLLMENYNGYFPGETPTPRLVDGGRILGNDCADGKKCFLPETYYFDVQYPGIRMVSVDTIDLSKDDAPVLSSAFIVSKSQEAFFSGESLYLSYFGSFDGSDAVLSAIGQVIEPKLTESVRALIGKISQTDASVLTPSEKSEKIANLYRSYLNSLDETQALTVDTEIENALKTVYVESKASTAIYKFSLSLVQPAYRALGSVEGELVASAVSEDLSGNFRAVSDKTVSLDITGKPARRAYVSVLDSDLKTIGTSVEISDNGDIKQAAFSARKISVLSGDAVYSADLTDPRGIKSLGKVGVSSAKALYPYDDNYAVAVGGEDGQVKAVLIDISGQTSRESDIFRFGNGSETVFDASFQPIDTKNNHIVLPIIRRAGSAISFSGITALSIGEGRFILRGDIDHSDGGRYIREDASFGAGFRDNTVRNTWVQNGSLYTFSNKYIKVNALEGGAALQAIKLLPDTEADLAAPQPVKTEETPETNSGDGPIGPALPPEVAPETPTDTNPPVLPDGTETLPAGTQPEIPAPDPLETPVDPIDLAPQS